MGSFFHGLSWIFPRLIDHTVEISILICLIFLVKLLASKKLPPWWHYSLWLLLLVRMVLPLAYENRLNIFNFVPAVDTPHVSGFISDASPEVEMSVQPVVLEPETVNPDLRFAVTRSIPVIWLAGAIIFGICLLFESVSFWRNVRRRPKVTDDAVLALLSECKSRMKIRRKIDIVVTDTVRSPALFGYLRPRLLLPEGIFEKLSDKELSFAFMHELGHLKRHDIGVSWLIAGLQVIHWFNPLVWFAFYQLRVDQESACDEAVLSRMKSRQSADYAKAIVGFLEKFCQNCQLPALAGVLENKSQMRKRIVRIVQYRKSSQIFSFIAFVLLLSAGLMLFSLTGVAADKGPIASLESGMDLAPLEAQEAVMETRSGGAENNSYGFRVEVPVMDFQLVSEESLSMAALSEFSSMGVSESNATSFQREVPAESREVSNEAAGDTRSSEGVGEAKFYIALAETSDPQPSITNETEQVAARNTAEYETPALVPPLSKTRIPADNIPAIASKSRDVFIENSPVRIVAEQEMTPGDGEPIQSFPVADEIAAGQKGQVGNHDRSQAYTGLMPENKVYPDVQNGTISASNYMKNEKTRTNSIAAVIVDKITKKASEEIHQGFSTASMVSKQKIRSDMGTFQAAEVDTPPRLIKRYPMRYPYLAKRDDITGSITLQFVVTKEGNTVGATVVESDPKGVFDEAAIQAVEQYRFKPGIKDGEAVDVRVNLPIRFNLT